MMMRLAEVNIERIDKNIRRNDSADNRLFCLILYISSLYYPVSHKTDNFLRIKNICLFVNLIKTIAYGHRNLKRMPR